MKPTASRTGLHKVRVGDRVVIAGHRSGDDVVTKIGRLFVHCGRDAFRINDGCHSRCAWGRGLTAWEPEVYEVAKRRGDKAEAMAQRTRWGWTQDLTESQLDRILAILEEVQT